MRFNASVYISGTSPVHLCDARVKLVLLVGYSVTLFFVRTWVGLGLCALLFILVLLMSRVPLRTVFGLLVPIYVIVAFTVLFNGFSFDIGQARGEMAGLGNVSAGMFSSWQPIPLIDSFGFVPVGFVRGCFYAVRIILLVAASLVVSFTTTSTDLTRALDTFLRPLRMVHVPTDDITMVFSLALRFIPVTAEEFGRVHDAQWVRGASFGEGSLWRRLRAWQTVLIPLFVGLFRRADVLATAMDARCYGAGKLRTTLQDRRLTPQSVALLVAGSAVCFVLGALG